MTADAPASIDAARAALAAFDAAGPATVLQTVPALAFALRSLIPEPPTEEERGQWTDARIREAFIDDGGLAEYHDPIHGAAMQRRVMGGIFDAWLAERDRRPCGPITDEARDAALREWRAHEWDPTPQLCACGEFFPAIGREKNGHPEHRMRVALEAARAVQ